MSLELLKTKGVCCSVSVSYPRYRYKLDPSKFRVNVSSAEAKKLVKLGSACMLADALKPVSGAEGRIRTAFNWGTYSLGYGAGLRFCPVQGLPRLMDRLKEGKEEMNSAVELFLANFDTAIESVKRDWAKVVSDQSFLTPEQQTELLDYYIGQLPMQPPGRSQFQVSSHFMELAMPGEPKFSAITETEIDMQREAWRQAKVRAAEDAGRMSAEFVGNCRRELMGRMQDFFTDMTALLSEGKPIHKRTVSRVQDFLQQIHALNFMNDESVKIMADSLKEAFGNDFTTRIEEPAVISGIRSTISSALNQVQADLLTMATADDRRFVSLSEAQTKTSEQTPAVIPAGDILF